MSDKRLLELLQLVRVGGTKSSTLVDVETRWRFVE